MSTTAGTLPQDADLTQKGLAATGAGQVLILACGALAREILTLTKSLPHVDLHCLPAILHNHPEKIPGAVEQALLIHSERYKKIYLAYADCGTGGQLQSLCDRLEIEMIAGPHCYSFFEGNAAFDARDEMTAFYVTDFLVRQFDAFVIKPLGLDRHPELRDMYFGAYEKLVYQAQSPTPDLRAKAQNCAQILGLEYEYRETGFGDLCDFVDKAAKQA